MKDVSELRLLAVALSEPSLFAHAGIKFRSIPRDATARRSAPPSLRSDVLLESVSVQFPIGLSPQLCKDFFNPLTLKFSVAQQRVPVAPFPASSRPSNDRISFQGIEGQCCKGL